MAKKRMPKYGHARHFSPHNFAKYQYSSTKPSLFSNKNLVLLKCLEFSEVVGQKWGACTGHIWAYVDWQ